MTLSIAWPTPEKVLLPACLLVFAWVGTPIARAQHFGHPGGGGHSPSAGRVSAPHIAIPRASHPTISRPAVGSWRRPIIIRRRVFLRPPFFRSRLGFYNSWWGNCGPLWSWAYGCNDLFLYGSGFENYVTVLPYEVPVYLYGSGDHQLVELFLKDGTAWSVADYWFVDDQVHFITVEEGGAKSVERTMALSALDLQRTIDVNTQRGFRVVKRDEPLELYLQHHPEANPPLVEVPK